MENNLCNWPQVDHIAKHSYLMDRIEDCFNYAVVDSKDLLVCFSHKLESEDHHHQAFIHLTSSMVKSDNPGFYDIDVNDISLGCHIPRENWINDLNLSDAPYGWVIVTPEIDLHLDILAANKSASEFTAKARNANYNMQHEIIRFQDIQALYKIVGLQRAAI